MRRPLNMCYYGNETLIKPSDPIEKIDDELREFAMRMILTMHMYNGIGLAAPQVGKNIRMFVIDLPLSEGMPSLHDQMPLVMVNPTLDNFSSEEGVMGEGCLSIPNVNGDVKRPLNVDVTYEDLTGKQRHHKCTGMLARCIQHEYDHLQGILFTELIPKAQLKKAQSKLNKIKRKT